MSPSITRTSRTLAGLGAGLVVAAGLSVVGSPSAVAAPTTKTIQSHTMDFSETRATGHHDFGPNGVRVYTDGATSTDKAAAYFDVDLPLADAAADEPVMSWTKNAAQAGNSRPGNQLKVDFDADGNIDGILVGEPTYADGSPLYGDDWWLTNGSEQFVKDAAPLHTGGSGSDNHGTLDQWSAAFEDAQVIQGGWSLGSGVQGDGVISSMTVGETTYQFVQSAAPVVTTLYPNDVVHTDTRATGHNDFLATGGVRVYTEGTTSTDKATGYFDTDVALADAGEPAMDYTATVGTVRPGLQLVTDFDGDGTTDGILVGEPVYANGTVLYGRTWWLNNGASQTVKDNAPSHAGGFGSDNNGTLTEWRAAFPNAKVLQAGWSLGSGVLGDGVINAITVGLDRFEFTGANRAPALGDVSATARSGQSVTVTLPGTDADGDELTYASETGTVTGDKLEIDVAPAVPQGTYQVQYTATDGTDTTEGVVTLAVQKAGTAAVLTVAPAKITTATKRTTIKVALTSTGAESGNVFFFDGAKKLGKAVLKANGTAQLVVTKKLAQGKHVLKVVYYGNGSTLATQKSVTKFVKKG